MANLSPDEIYRAARSAGFSPDQAVTMTAIALAESGGNPAAHNGSGEDSWGLWQINLDAHKSWVQEMGLNLSDPNDNAKAAFRVSGGGATISPWTVTHQGKGARYLGFRQQAETAAANAGEEAHGNWSASPGYGTSVSAGDSGGPAWTGQTTVYGGGANQVAGAASTTADTRSPEEYAMQEYGQLAVFLQDPEIGPILQRAANEKWSKEKLQGELHKTDWWNRTNESARQWMALEGADPIEAQSQVNGQIANIMSRANQLGYPITRDRAEVIARNSLKYGWQGAELDNAIGADAGQVRLLTSSFGTSLRQTQRAYGVPLSEAALGDWATRIASGQDTEENFVAYMRDQAINMYPTIAGYLQAGGTTDKYFSPYMETAAKVLGIAPDSIDLTDPKWGAALSTPDDQGNRRSLNMDEWQRLLMSDDRYGFRYTENAQNMAEDMVGKIKRQMGIIV